jgi:hypothetical protein
MLLNSLHIKGFRGFADFKVEGLGRVNLIVGSNNAGKTSLLEAIYLLRARLDDPFVAISRGEEMPACRLSLFNGWPSAESTPEVVIGSDDPRDTLKMTLSPAGITVLRPKRGGEGGELDRQDFPLSGTAGVPSVMPILMEPGTKVGFDIVQVWGRIELTPRETDLVNCMKLVVPDIEHVRLSIVNRKPIVQLRNNQTPVSMANLGGGATRLFHLACGLILSVDDVCLVEEIENGVHHSVHPKMWAFILGVAKMHNIQVFATTHSLDCLRGFALASRELPEVRARVIRLDNEDGQIVPVMFDEEETRIAAREDIEIR